MFCVNEAILEPLEAKAGPQIRLCNRKLFSYFSTKTYETVLLSTKTHVLTDGKEYNYNFTLNFFCLTGPM